MTTTEAKKFYTELRKQVAEIEHQAIDLGSIAPRPNHAQTLRRRLAGNSAWVTLAFGASALASALYNANALGTWFVAGGLLALAATHLVRATVSGAPVFEVFHAMAESALSAMLFFGAAFDSSYPGSVLCLVASSASFASAILATTEVFDPDRIAGRRRARTIKRARRLGNKLDTAISCADTDPKLGEFSEREWFREQVSDLKDELDSCPIDNSLQ